MWCLQHAECEAIVWETAVKITSHNNIAMRGNFLCCNYSAGGSFKVARHNAPRFLFSNQNALSEWSGDEVEQLEIPLEKNVGAFRLSKHIWNRAENCERTSAEKIMQKHFIFFLKSEVQSRMYRCIIHNVCVGRGNNNMQCLEMSQQNRNATCEH